MGRVWTEETLEKQDGLKIVARWARTENPDFSHYGRFVTVASECDSDEVLLKNPRCWRGAELIRTDLKPYFAVSRFNITSQVDEICPDEGDTEKREQAMAFVIETWKPLIKRIADGDYRAIDIDVAAFVDATGVELYRQTFRDIEVDEAFVEPEMDTVMTLIDENSVILDVRVEASRTLREMLATALFHGLSMEEREALVLAVDFHNVNAEEDADAKATQRHLNRIKAMAMTGGR